MPELAGLLPEEQKVVHKALSKNPADRYESCDQFVSALGRVLLTERSRDAFRREGTARRAVVSETDSIHLEFSGEPPSPEPPAPPYQHDNVQFTVFRPKVITTSAWHRLLAFAHLDELPADASPDDPDPWMEVQKQAQAILGNDLGSYRETTQESRMSIPREGELTFIPEVPGVQFNPSRRSFLWIEDVHREEFSMRALPMINGLQVRGRMCVFLGSILLAEITMTFRAQNKAPVAGQGDPHQRTSARPYRKIFASYSHQDTAIVEQCERYSLALGDTYLRDVTQLRAGEIWTDRLAHMIEEADIFQLFWSRSAMHSPFVQQEWSHALRLNRREFIRPTYWEDPFPEAPGQNLPPPELRQLHFQRLDWGSPITPHAAPGTPSREDPPRQSPPTDRIFARSSALPALAAETSAREGRGSRERGVGMGLRLPLLIAAVLVASTLAFYLFSLLRGK